MNLNKFSYTVFMDKPKIAVIGIGIMGHGIADNFIKNGYETAVWNRTENKCDSLAKNGALVTKSIKDAVEFGDIIFEVSANDESSRAIWFDNQGILNSATNNKILVTCATLSASFVEELNVATDKTNTTFFDMPLTGGSTGAKSGQLTLLVGGNKEKLDLIKPVLVAIAKDVKYFGEVGAGTKYKLILNSVQASHMVAFGEAMRLAKTAGLDVDLVGKALVDRPGGISTKIAYEGYMQEPKEVSFSVEWMAKDLGYASQLSKDIEVPIFDIALEEYEKTMANGDGKSDFSMVNKYC
jgi:3-hydroxyisobutyrate dehydrogenase